MEALSLILICAPIKNKMNDMTQIRIDKDEIQKSKLRKFLETEQIDIGNLIETLGDTHPYSLLKISTKDVEELKKKD